jgi:flagellar biosynthesis/type III secretory pathway protein FliH
MLEYIPMSMPTRQELLARFAKVDDPEIEARRQQILEALLEASPQTQQRLIDQGRAEGLEKGLEKGLENGLKKGQLTGARKALRRVLARRGLIPNPAAEERIEDCLDLTTLERWLDQAITARSVAEALR